jgi:hypothetical protein
MAMTKRYDHANEERYGAAIEALDAAGKTSSAEALAAARWKQTYLDFAAGRWQQLLERETRLVLTTSTLAGLVRGVSLRLKTSIYNLL